MQFGGRTLAAGPGSGKVLPEPPGWRNRPAMHPLALLGLVLTVSGLAGLVYCVMQGIRIRGRNLPPAEIHARLHRLIAVNLGSVALSALGLAVLVIGVIL